MIGCGHTGRMDEGTRVRIERGPGCLPAYDRSRGEYLT